MGPTTGTLAMTRHKIVTLASIIGRSATPEERPIISAVYHNRLRITHGAPGGSHRPVRPRGHTSRVLYKDLETISLQHLPRMSGLPQAPSPPGASSIEAALFPANVPYLYFFAHPDGTTSSLGLRQHLAAQAKLRRRDARGTATIVRLKRQKRWELQSEKYLSAVRSSARQLPHDGTFCQRRAD